MSFRKISAAILAVIMCFSVHLGCAFADEGIEGETVAVIGDSTSPEFLKTLGVE